MDLIQILPYAIFGAITALIWFVVSLMGEKDSRASERLEDIRDPSRRLKNDTEGKEGVSGLLGKAAPALSKALQPKTELEESVLKIRLANAGLIRPMHRNFIWR